MSHMLSYNSCLFTEDKPHDAPHVDVEGVYLVDAEAARPVTTGVVHDAHTQQLVQVQPRPVERQLAAR